MYIIEMFKRLECNHLLILSFKFKLWLMKYHTVFNYRILLSLMKKLVCFDVVHSKAIKRLLIILTPKSTISILELLKAWYLNNIQHLWRWQTNFLLLFTVAFPVPEWKIMIVAIFVLDMWRREKKLIRITLLCKEVITQCIAPPNFCLPTQRSLLELESIL